MTKVRARPLAARALLYVAHRTHRHAPGQEAEVRKAGSGCRLGQAEGGSSTCRSKLANSWKWQCDLYTIKRLMAHLQWVD